MKPFIAIFFLLICNAILAQSIENLKYVDTVYIYFKHCSYEYKYDISETKRNRFSKNNKIYHFKISKSNHVIFFYNTYKDFDTYNKNIITKNKIVKKSFLRKNKDKILDIDFFIKNGFKETFFALYGKVIYLIDKDEIKKGKITLKEVKISSNYIEE